MLLLLPLVFIFGDSSHDDVDDIRECSTFDMLHLSQISLTVAAWRVQHRVVVF